MGRPVSRRQTSRQTETVLRLARGDVSERLAGCVLIAAGICTAVQGGGKRRGTSAKSP